MKNYKILGILLIPVLAGILALGMKAAIGPYWLGTNNDPAYIYLINFLYILDGILPHFVEHPGTTLQVLGAVIIKLFNLPVHGEALVENVFRDPEFYMNAVFYVLFVLFLSTLALLGWYVYRKTNDVLCAVFFQLPALLYLTLRSYGTDQSILPIIVNVDAEPLLITVNNLFLMCFVAWYFKKEKSDQNILAVLFGVVCAFGVATKVLFLPMMLIPACLLRPFRNKAVFFGSFMVSFFIFILPIVPYFWRTLEWVTDLVTREDQGAGRLGLDPAVYILELKRVVSENMLLFIVTLMSAGVVWWNKAQGRHTKANRGYFLVVLTAISYFFIIARHPAPHYMVPPTGLIGLMLFLCYESLAPFKLKRKLFWVIVGLFIAAQSFWAVHYQKSAYAYSQSIYEFSQKVYTKYKDCMVCGYYRSSSPAFALQFGDDNAGRLAYNKILRKVYPDTYYFHYWSRLFHDGLKDISFAELKKMNDCILIYGLRYSHDFDDKKFWILEKVESGPTENVFRVHTSVAEIATENFQVSRMLYQRGDYQKAYEYALKARSLGMPNIDAYLQRLTNIIKQLK